MAGIMSSLFLHAADARYVILRLNDFEQDADPAKAVPAEWQKLYDFKVIDFLLERNYRFVTPTEYVRLSAPREKP